MYRCTVQKESIKFPVNFCPTAMDRHRRPFTCPIAHELMEDPVVVSDGRTCKRPRHPPPSDTGDLYLCGPWPDVMKTATAASSATPPGGTRQKTQVTPVTGRSHSAGTSLQVGWSYILPSLQNVELPPPSRFSTLYPPSSWIQLAA